MLSYIGSVAGRIQVTIECPACEGCQLHCRCCGGTGGERYTCSLCGGKGYAVCAQCHGTGEILKELDYVEDETDQRGPFESVCEALADIQVMDKAA